MGVEKTRIDGITEYSAHPPAQVFSRNAHPSRWAAHQSSGIASNSASIGSDSAPRSVQTA